MVKCEKILDDKSYVLQALLYIETVLQCLTNIYHIFLFDTCNIYNAFVRKWGPKFSLSCHIIITKKIQMLCNVIVFKNEPSNFIGREHGREHWTWQRTWQRTLSVTMSPSDVPTEIIVEVLKYRLKYCLHLIFHCFPLKTFTPNSPAALYISIFFSISRGIEVTFSISNFLSSLPIWQIKVYP